MSGAARLPVAPAEIAAAVSDREFRRLLGLPRTGEVAGPEVQAMRDVRQWYTTHGDPFVATRRVEVVRIGPASVTLASGAELPGRAVASVFAAQAAHAAVAVAASAGPRIAAEAARSWQDGRPDAGYALDRFAAAVAEELLRHASTWLCDAFLPEGGQLTRHLAPGCGDWDIDHQRDVMALLSGGTPRDATGGRIASVGPVTLLDSGALQPQHSVLAVFGVSRHARKVTPEAACRACDLVACAFRRMPFAGCQTSMRVNS